MERLSTITKKDFVDQCIGKIQEGRMLSLSSLFFPVYNASGYLPVLTQQTMANIASIAGLEGKKKAKDAFVDICVQWYGLSGKMHRGNCVNAINNIDKNPLFDNIGEAQEYKATLVEALFEKYSAHYLPYLKQDFPDFTKQFHKQSSQHTADIANTLATGTEALKNKPIHSLQDLLQKSEKNPHEKYAVRDIVKALLCQYMLEQKTGRDWMSADNYGISDVAEALSRGSLIQKYTIGVDELVEQIYAFGLENKIYNVAKVRVFIKTYTPEQRESSPKALELLHHMYKNAIKFGKFVICRTILSSVDLSKYFDDIQESLGAVTNSMMDKGGVVGQIKNLLKAGKTQESLKYAKALGKVYIDTTYKLALGIVANDSMGLSTIDHLLENKNLITDQELIHSLCKRRVTILLTFDEDVYNPEEARNYIKEYAISQEYLDTMIKTRFDGLLGDNLSTQYEAKYISYLDKFPLPQQKINTHKFNVLVSMYKPSLHIQAYLSQEEENSSILDALKTKLQNVYNSSMQLPDTIDEQQSFIVGELLDVKKSEQEKKLSPIFNHLFQTDNESYVLKLMQKLGSKYSIDYKHRLPLLVQNVANKKSSGYGNIKRVMKPISIILKNVEGKESIYTACIDKIISKIVNDTINKDNDTDDQAGAYDMIDSLLNDINEDIYGDKKQQAKRDCIKNLRDKGSSSLAEYLLDNFIQFIDDTSSRVTKLFDTSVESKDYDLSEKLLSDYKKYINTAVTLQHIRIKKVQKSIEQAQSTGLQKEDFDNILHLIENAGKDEKVVKELVTLLSTYTVLDQEGYDFLHTIYAIDTNQELHTAIQQKILECCMVQFDLQPKKRIMDLDLQMYYNLLKNLCEQHNISDQYARQLPRVIEDFYRLHYKKHRGYQSMPEDYLSAYVFCNQVHDAKELRESNDIHLDRADRYKKKNNTRTSYIAAEYDLIDKSLQVLRGVGDLYKDMKGIKQGKQLEQSIQDLYAFTVVESASKTTQQKVLEVLKEYYALTGQTDKLQALIQEHQSKEEKQKSLRQELIDFLHDTDNVSLKQLEDLIAFLGIDSAADILFSQYPQFALLGSMEVKSLIAEHLGDVLLQHTGLSFVDIPAGLDIRPKKFQDNMLTVIEKDFLKYYRETKKPGTMTDQQICTSYMQSLRDKFTVATSHADVLAGVADKFAAFLDQILTIQIPDRLVTSLDDDREFPDFLQKLNAIEILNKKRFLVADGMGMGKSLSSILAKEVGGFQKCLLIVPSNTMDTWSEYLSDKTDAEGKPVGYFVKGKAPKVLIIDSFDELENISSDDYEYVIMSQERLASEKSVDKLLQEKFDYVIVDEIHKLKNISEGKRASGLLNIAEKIEHMDGYLCLLSGTPIPNTVIDIAILIKLLYPEEYGSRDNQELVSSIINGDIVSLRSLLLPRMQMKELTENINMPELRRETKYAELSEREQFYYDSIRNDDNLTLLEKLMLLRKLCISPKLLGIQDIDSSTKAIQVGNDVRDMFKTKKKVVLFFNAFIKGVLRPTESISQEETFINQMGLDPDIQVRIIDGVTEKADRKKIQDEFASSDEKILLFVSGQTADVGIDLTPGEEVATVVKPRTKSDEDQQLARVFRYRQKKNINATEYIINHSIEKVISDYVFLKHKAIMKLYHGLKLTDVEKMVLDDVEVSGQSKGSSSKNLNRGLIRYFKKSTEELGDFYGNTKGAGSQKVGEVIEENGENIAGYYKGLSSRSYQANVNRRHATVIENILDHASENDPIIVDLGSGPKMLQQHIHSKLKDVVISVDLNKHNFTPEDISSGKAIVANFVHLPFADDSVDIISSSLAFNDTSRRPNAQDYERLAALQELQRILKMGGSAIISIPHSMTYKNKDLFAHIIKELGFTIQDTYSGNVSTQGFRVETITLTKTKDIDKTLEELVDSCTFKGLMSGLAFTKNADKIVSTKNVITSVQLDDNTIPIQLNQSSKHILQTEQNYNNIVREWIDKYGDVMSIPMDVLRSYGFGRYCTKKNAVLLAQLPNNAGLFSYRKTRKVDEYVS